MDFYEFDKILRALAAAEIEARAKEEKDNTACTCCRAHTEPYVVMRQKKEKKPSCGCEVCGGGGLIKGAKLFKMSYTDKEIKMVPIEVKYCPNCGKELG